MTVPRLSVILPTRNPNRERLALVLAGIRAQTLPGAAWELCVVDNGSAPPLTADLFTPQPAPVRIIAEARPGLFWARIAGLSAAAGRVILFLDDDTIPRPGTFAAVVDFMAAHPEVGTAGGRIHARYLAPPPPWIDEVEWALALRNWGEEPRVWRAGDADFLPNWTPIGAGLVVASDAVPAYLQHARAHAETIQRRSWRGQGTGGNEDKDLVLALLRAGWATAYCPGHELEHLIPAHRLRANYFTQLLPVLGELWELTLFAHGWEFEQPIPAATVPLRRLRAWWRLRAWRGPRERFRWLSKCGSYAGRARNRSDAFRYPIPPR